MAQHLRFSIWSAAALVGVMTLGSALYGQDPVPPEGSGRSRADYWIETGVMKRITPDPQRSETFTAPRPIVELIANSKVPDWEPNFAPKSDTLREKALRAIYRRDIWNLEFSFKPLRMIEVDVPRPDGRLERKLIWYMVYRVKNNGNHWKPKEVPQPTTEGVEHTVFGKDLTNEAEVFGRKSTSLRFFPKFVLRSIEQNVEYTDKVIPSALEPIRRREFPGTNQPLYNSLTISEVPIELSDETHDRSVWGVVTFEDVDPAIDYFSLFVHGLTNAYKYEDPAGAFKAGDPPGTGRKLLHKTLQLNFWRPGDRINQNEDEVRFGVRLDSNEAEQQRILKLYGLTERLDYLWVYQ